MLAFLSMLEEKYGGVERYLEDVVQLTHEDVLTIRTNILTPRAS